MVSDLPRTAGRYEIHRLLGRGGMASVHLARQPALDRAVALKELHSVHIARRRGRPSLPARIARRRGAQSRERRDGDRVLRARGRAVHRDGVPRGRLAAVARGTTDARAGRRRARQRAQRAGRGRRARDRAPRSQARERARHGATATPRSPTSGSPRRSATWAWRDFRTATGADRRHAGLHGAGADQRRRDHRRRSTSTRPALIAYELLAGRHPFDNTDAPMALLMHHVNDEPPPLASVRPDLPPGVVAWVHAMLAKEPDARPAGAAHAWDRLDGVVCDALGPRWRRDATLPAPAGRAGPGGPAAARPVRDLLGRPAPAGGADRRAGAAADRPCPRRWRRRS